MAPAFPILKEIMDTPHPLDDSLGMSIAFDGVVSLVKERAANSAELLALAEAAVKQFPNDGRFQLLLEHAQTDHQFSLEQLALIETTEEN